MSSKLQNIAFLATLVWTAGVSASAQSSPPKRFAVIDMQKAVPQTQEFKSFQAILDAKLSQQREELQNLYRDIEYVRKQLTQTGLDSSRAERLQAEQSKKEKQIRRLSEDIQTDMTSLEKDGTVTRIRSRMVEVTKRLAEQRGIELAIDTSNVIRFDPALDITKEAVEAYDKSYPSPTPTRTEEQRDASGSASQPSGASQDLGNDTSSSSSQGATGSRTPSNPTTCQPTLGYLAGRIPPVPGNSKLNELRTQLLSTSIPAMIQSIHDQHEGRRPSSPAIRGLRESSRAKSGLYLASLSTR